jgi:hypothetical protein
LPFIAIFFRFPRGAELKEMKDFGSRPAEGVLGPKINIIRLN